MSDAPEFHAWAPWHPKHGFEIPHYYEGQIAFADLDGAVRLVKSLNREDGTSKVNGWRASKVKFVKVTA